MKKVISLILAICLVASMAVCASAAKPVIVTHDQSDWDTQNRIDHGYYDGVSTYCSLYNGYVDAGDLVRLTADYVKVLDITDGTEQTWTKCAEALTTAEGVAICEADERLNNLTVFRQRNVTNPNGAIDISVKLWPCNPEKKTNQAVVILFRAEGAEEWSVVGYNNESNECTATLPGNGAYVVALAW